MKLCQKNLCPARKYPWKACFFSYKTGHLLRKKICINFQDKNWDAIEKFKLKPQVIIDSKTLDVPWNFLENVKRNSFLMQKSTFFLMQNSTNSPDCFASTYYEKVSIQIVQKFKRRKLETETLNNNYTVFSVRNSKREVPRYEVPQMSQMYCSRNYANSSFTKFTIFILHEVNTKFSWCL